MEHEYDHVHFGTHDVDSAPNPEEAEDWKWMEITELSVDVKTNPGAYSSRLAICLDQIVACRERLPTATIKGERGSAQMALNMAPADPA